MHFLITYEEVWSFEGGNEACPRGYLSPHGLSSTVENIKRRREKRYYKLLCLFADQVRNAIGAWLEKSCIYSALCEQIMRCTQVKHALRMDHSIKFCKQLKIWPGGTGKRESMKTRRCLLLFKTKSANRRTPANPLRKQ
ncbi:hypothetical protein GQ600_7099 [Phytophthora cactorum]|nr:hypothetical protein GQ600_7099 [Phytophthora cactorum]